MLIDKCQKIATHATVFSHLRSWNHQMLGICAWLLTWTTNTLSNLLQFNFLSMVMISAVMGNFHWDTFLKMSLQVGLSLCLFEPSSPFSVVCIPAVYVHVRQIFSWELCMSSLLLLNWMTEAKRGRKNKLIFLFVSFFSLYCNVVVLVLVCVSFFLSGSLATFGLGRFSLLVSKSVLCLPLSACWLTQVSPCPRMPLHPQQPSAFGLQLPETVPELLCLCSHTHLHWYAEAGKEVDTGERKEAWNTKK